MYIIITYSYICRKLYLLDKDATDSLRMHADDMYSIANCMKLCITQLRRKYTVKTAALFNKR